MDVHIGESGKHSRLDSDGAVGEQGLVHNNYSESKYDFFSLIIRPKMGPHVDANKVVNRTVYS